MTGGKLARASGETVRVWDLSSGELAAVIPHSRPVTKTCLSETGRLLTSQTDGGILVWDLGPPRQAAVFKVVGAPHRIAIGIWGVDIPASNRGAVSAEVLWGPRGKCDN